MRWHRCLRCDSWVALTRPDPPGRRYPPDRDEIRIPLRGKALRDRFVLRLIAVDRVVHFIVLCGLGVAVLFLAAHERSLKQDYYRILTALQRGVGGGPVQTRGHHTGILGELDKVFSLQSGHLREVGLALLAYGILEGVEGIGLWYGKRWAEYLTFVAVTVLLPLEIYELLHGATALKIIGFVINLAIVIFLLFSKRLFGMRGGGAADERERSRDMSWEALERATPPVGAPAAG